MSIFYSSHFLRIKSSTNAVDQLYVPRGQTQEKDDKAHALEEKLFLYVPSTQNVSSRWEN